MCIQSVQMFVFAKHDEIKQKRKMADEDNNDDNDDDDNHHHNIVTLRTLLEARGQKRWNR